MDQYCKLFAICAGLQVHCTLCTICNDIVSAFEEWWLETIIDCTPVDRQSTPRKIHFRGKSTIARQQIKRQSWKNAKSKIAQNDTQEISTKKSCARVKCADGRIFFSPQCIVVIYLHQLLNGKRFQIRA